MDLEDAEARLRQAVEALRRGDPQEAASLLEVAADVAGRPFLPEAEGSWVQSRRTGQRALEIRALETLAQARLASGRPVEAASAARQAIDLDPFRESSHRALMAAHAAAGNRAQALVAYEHCRRLLADELGVDPSPQTETLFLGLLRMEAAQPESTPAPPDRAETAPDRAAGPTPAPRAPDPGRLAAEEPIRRRLPARLQMESTGLLVGRNRELDVIRRRIERASAGAGGVVLICGDAGMGKTALVAHAAREARVMGTLVLYGRCDEELTLAYHPIVEALVELTGHLTAEHLAEHLGIYGTGLLRLVPELRQRAPSVIPEAGADPETERHLVFRSVAALLHRASAMQPVTMIVDDLHWADKPTQLLLRYLAEAASGTSLLLVVTYRGLEAKGIDDVARTVHELGRQLGAERLAPALKGTPTLDRTSNSDFILMDETVQYGAPSNLYTLGRPGARIGAWIRRLEVKASVRPSPVVVGGIEPKHPFQVAAAEHDHPVQALGSDRADPPLGEGVRSGSPDRGLDDPHAFGAQHLVERSGERRVAVPDHEPDPVEPLPHCEVAGLLGDPRRVWVPGDAEDVHAAGPELDGEQDVQRAKHQRLGGEEVKGQDPPGLGTAGTRSRWDRPAGEPDRARSCAAACGWWSPRP